MARRPLRLHHRRRLRRPAPSFGRNGAKTLEVGQLAQLMEEHEKLKANFVSANKRGPRLRVGVPATRGGRRKGRRLARSEATEGGGFQPRLSL